MLTVEEYGRIRIAHRPGQVIEQTDQPYRQDIAAEEAWLPCVWYTIIQIHALSYVNMCSSRISIRTGSISSVAVVKSSPDSR